MKKQLLYAAAFLFGSTAVAQTGGPDSWGYTYANSNAGGGPTYSWIEIDSTLGGAGMSDDLLINGDDENVSFALSFNFPFYGASYDSVKVSTNGTVSFGADGDYFGLSNVCIPGTAYNDTAFIATFWDDLDPSAGGMVFFQDFGTYAVIEWSNVYEYGGSDGDTWEVILYANGNILMQYKETSAMQANTGYTVGINGTTTDGLEYLCNGTGDAIADNLAILYTEPASGISEGNKPELEIFPNPNNGEFNLTITSSSNDLSVKITDVQGRAVYTKQFNANAVKEVISLDGAAAGMYYVTVNNGLTVVTERIIVQ